jgi:hypothetical protein
MTTRSVDDELVVFTMCFPQILVASAAVAPTAAVRGTPRRLRRGDDDDQPHLCGIDHADGDELTGDQHRRITPALRPNRPGPDSFKYRRPGDTDDQQRAQVALHQLVRDGSSDSGLPIHRHSQRDLGKCGDEQIVACRDHFPQRFLVVTDAPSVGALRTAGIPYEYLPTASANHPAETFHERLLWLDYVYGIDRIEQLDHYSANSPAKYPQRP